MLPPDVKDILVWACKQRDRIWRRRWHRRVCGLYFAPSSPLASQWATEEKHSVSNSRSSISWPGSNRPADRPTMRSSTKHEVPMDFNIIQRSESPACLSMLPIVVSSNSVISNWLEQWLSVAMKLWLAVLRRHFYPQFVTPFPPLSHGKASWW